MGKRVTHCFAHRVSPYVCAFALIVIVGTIIDLNGAINFWLFCTSPLTGIFLRGNPIIGYSDLFNDGLIHRENIPTFSLLNSFLTDFQDSSPYAARPTYPLLVSIFSPAIGAVAAAFLVNLIAWLAAAFSAIRLSELLTDRPFARWAALGLIVLGEGYWFHLQDYSAHMLSHCGYAVSVFLLAKIGVTKRDLDLRLEVAASAVLVTMSLTYNTGVPLLVAFSLFSLLAGAWRRVLFNVLLVAATQRLWPFLYAWSFDGGVIIQGTEASYAAMALGAWKKAFDNGEFFVNAARVAAQTIFSDPLNAAVLLICVIGLATKKVGGRNVWFVAVAGVLPMLAALPWMSYASARGYIANAGFGVLAVLAAVILMKIRFGPAIVVAVLVVQGTWLFFQSSGNIVPTYSYATGLQAFGDFFAGFKGPTQTVESLTGYERTPMSVGGSSTVPAAGGLGTSEFSFPQGKGLTLHLWTTRLYILLPLVIVALMLLRRRRVVLAVALAVFLFPPILSKAREPERYFIALTHHSFSAPYSLVTQNVALSASTWDALRNASQSGQRIELYSGTVNAVIEATLCGVRILRISADSTTHADRNLEPDALRLALANTACDRILRVKIEGTIKNWASWQRSGLPNRRLAIDGIEIRPGDINWPALELRMGPATGPDTLRVEKIFF